VAFEWLLAAVSRGIRREGTPMKASMRMVLGIALGCGACLALAWTLGAVRAEKEPKAEPPAQSINVESIGPASERINAKNWGEDIANPFTNLTDEGRERLKARGIDVERLMKLPARLLIGNYCGASRKHFINKDPDTILVLGKGFVTHGKVYSLGPILAVADAACSRDVVGANLVWFVEDSRSPEEMLGRPLIVAARDGDYGWRRPENFLTLPPTGSVPKEAPPADKEAEETKKRLQKRIASQRGVDVKEVTVEVANPFTNLTEEGRAKLKRRGVDVERLAKLPSRLLAGDYGPDAKTFVNKDPDTILVIGKGRWSYDGIYSMGPILAMDKAHFMDEVVGADLVWFVEESFPRDETAGVPVIFAPTADYSQMKPGSDEIWHGDYGWRPPKGFLKSLPAPNRPKQ
jgi:hypothetical protein